MSKKNARLNAKVGMGYAGGALQFVDDEHACYVHGNALRVFKVGAPPEYAAQRVKDLEEHFKDLQLLHVTKNLQAVMKEGERDPQARARAVAAVAVASRR